MLQGITKVVPGYKGPVFGILKKHRRRVFPNQTCQPAGLAEGGMNLQEECVAGTAVTYYSLSE